MFIEIGKRLTNSTTIDTMYRQDIVNEVDNTIIYRLVIPLINGEELYEDFNSEKEREDRYNELVLYRC